MEGPSPMNNIVVLLVEQTWKLGQTGVLISGIKFDGVGVYYDE